MAYKNIKIIFLNEVGATAIEYALIAALISVAIVGSVATLGNSLQTSFDATSVKVVDAISGN